MPDSMKLPRWFAAWLASAASFLPAIVFLLVARLGPGEPGVRWEHAYLVAGALAIVHAGWLMRRQVTHGIALGVDLYLVIGGVLALASADALRTWGEALGATSVLGCVLAVNLAGLLFAPRQFFGTGQGEAAQARGTGAAMLVATAAALVLAAWHRHDPVLGGVLPIVFLVLARGVLERRLRTAASAAS